MKTRACLAAVLAAVTLAACGGDSEGESTPAPAGSGSADGAQLFTQNCANCHALAAAKANGQVGPNLDQLRPGPDLVKAQTENGGGAMPPFKDKLTPEQIQAVANYVADNAGKSF